MIASDLDELFAYGEVLAAGTRPRGGRLHLVTNSGGEANLVADLAEDAGLTLPPLGPAAAEDLRAKWPRFHVANPLDPWGVDDYALVYPEAFRAVAGEPGDILAAPAQPDPLTEGEALAVLDDLGIRTPAALSATKAL
ncbi:MAG TPA: hypothetical protein VH008_30675 [Pseudonocardia sp.]|nr:hypothetical protein [Pseudonocardia sp.]